MFIKITYKAHTFSTEYTQGIMLVSRLMYTSADTLHAVGLYGQILKLDIKTREYNIRTNSGCNDKVSKLQNCFYSDGCTTASDI